MREADPIGWWIRVAKGLPVQVERGTRGKPRVMHQPTVDQVFRAREKLLAKVLPDLKNVEMAGDGGGPLVVQVVRFGDHPTS